MLKCLLLQCVSKFKPGWNFSQWSSGCLATVITFNFTALLYSTQITVFLYTMLLSSSSWFQSFPICNNSLNLGSCHFAGWNVIHSNRTIGECSLNCNLQFNTNKTLSFILNHKKPTTSISNRTFIIFALLR